jgi:hypothetical protein
MAKRKTKPPKNPRVEDLPQNPEFQEFAEFTRKLLQVPKEEIDRRAAEERARNQQAS